MLYKIAFILTTGLSSVIAQSAEDLSSGILGSCIDVDCPTGTSANNTAVGAACRVDNRTHFNVGLDSFSTNITGDQGNLTWTIAPQIFDGSGQRTIEKDFYLGSPPSLNLSDSTLPYQGCAVFLYNIKTVVPDDGSSPTCPTLVGEQCVSDLVEDTSVFTTNTIRNLTRNGTVPVEEVCRRLRYRFYVYVQPACRDLIDENNWENGIPGWNRARAVPITGASAPKPLSEAQEQNSNCHPTLPKTNDLTFAYGYNDTGTYYANDTLRMINGLNLVMTVFYPTDVEKLESDGSEVHLSCLWPVNKNSAGEENMQSSTGHRRAVGLSLGLSLAVAVAMYLLV